MAKSSSVAKTMRTMERHNRHQPRTRYLMACQRTGETVGCRVRYPVRDYLVCLGSCVGSMNYQTKGIFMDRYDGDQLFAALGQKIRSGTSLDELERMQLAFLPLMKSSHSKQERAVETIELAGMILDETQKTFLTGCVIAISDNFIDREYTRKILEVLRMSKVLRALEEEVKDEGRVEGRLEGQIEGRIEEKKATAKKLLLKGMSIDEVAEITGLLKEDIRSLH